MSLSRSAIAWGMLALLVPAGFGQEPVLPSGEGEPLLRLETSGPTSLVTGLAFGPDGATLYQTGWDKVVRVWTRNPDAGRFELDPQGTFRVPIGPGLDGALNALALSADGTWLAVAGIGNIRGGAGFRQSGLMIPAESKSDAMRGDEGLIHVFNTRTREVTLLRGHLGPVLSLAFIADGDRRGEPPLLVAAAREREGIGSVRLWDVAQKEYLGGLWNLPDPTTRPGLAAWRTGAGRAGIHVAIAWGDGSLRLWDVDRDRGRPRVIADGSANNSVLVLDPPAPGPVRLLTTASLQGRAVVTAWDTSVDPARPGSRVSQRVSAPLQDFPRALGLVADRPGAALSHAVVVKVRMAPRARSGEASLQLIDLRPGQFGTMMHEFPLWTFDPAKPSLPALAVDPSRQFVAVAGDPERTVRVFSVNDLFQGRSTPQVLSGEGATFERIAFATRGEAVGIRLGDVVFDTSAGTITADPAGWQDDDPAIDDWQVHVLPPRRDAQGVAVPASLAVRQGQGPLRSIRLRPNQAVTAHALLPPIAPRRAAIAAIAYEETGQPGLGLYNVEDGTQVRQLTGHAERITSLAFTRHGRFLASTAEDRTTCVWSLVDLDKTLGRRGSMAGLTVEARNGKLVVSRLNSDSPARSGDLLREGDEIEGLVTDGVFRPFTTSSDFYLALSLRVPGQAVAVRRTRAGMGRADVSIRVSQAVDERKPLFSLFVAAQAGAWIGWSPLGPYESSGREAERLLGWHFNTGKADAPTRFAMADQYQEFRRPGILKELIERGGPAPAPVPPPLPRPGMSLRIDPAGELDDGGQLVVRQAPATLSLVLLDRGMAAGTVDSVRWKIDDVDQGALVPAADGIWSADLAGRTWRQGEYRLAVALRTREAVPQDFHEWRTVRYQPPPPSLEARGAPRGPEPFVVESPEFTFRAGVRPAGVPVKVRLVHRTSDGRRSQNDWQADQPIEIDQRLTLAPGDNTFELVAENQGALPGHEDLETSRLPLLRVHYKRVPARPPEVVLDRLVPIRNGAEASPIAIDPGGATIVVAVPKVRLHGRLAGAAPLSEAVLVRDEGNVSRPLSGFAPGRDRAWTLDEVLDLAPGPQLYRVRGRVADSESAEGSVTVEYRPPLPVIAELTTDPSEVIVDGKGDGTGPPLVRLSARLVAPEDRQPFRAVVLLNDRELPEPATIDAAGELVTAQVPVIPGENQVRLRLSNAWREVAISDPVSVVYRRPPQIVTVDRPVVDRQPFIDVAATIATPADLPLTRVRVEVQGTGPGVSPREVDPRSIRRDQSGTTWSIVVRGVPVEPGRNQVKVLAWNGDGPCRQPGVIADLAYTAPPPPRPEVVIVSPGRDTTLAAPSAPLEFRVRSASPLTRVEIVRVASGARREVVETIDAAAATRDRGGMYELTTTATVPLQHHDNRLQVVAVNAGGEESAAINVSYPPPPVRVLVDRLVPEDRSEPEVAIAGRISDPRAFTAQLHQGAVAIHGRVVWPDQESRRTRDVGRVQVWINGFPFSFVRLARGSADSLESKFEAALLLNRKDNQVEVKVPDLPLESCDRSGFRVACEQPERRQRLHLLVVGVGEDDEEALRGRAIKAVEGHLRTGSKTAFETPAFADGWIYGPLCRDVRRTQVMFQISQILSAIRPPRDPTAAPLEVVWIYYQGDEGIDDGKSVLRLRRLRDLGRRDVMALDELVGFFDGVRGAQLVLLDVTRSAPLLLSGPPPAFDGDVHGAAGLLRFSWLNEAERRDDYPPTDAQLLTAIAGAMPHAATVRDLVAELSRKHDELRKIYPNLSYDRYLPEKLSNLALGIP